MFKAARGWHSRGRLPHFDGGPIIQMLNTRLFDSLPQHVLANWRRELSGKSADHISKQMRRKLERYLDMGLGACFLGHRGVAQMYQDSLRHFDGERYKLYAWVVMPNHVHLLLRPLVGFSLSGIEHSLNSYTAQQANKMLKRKGKFWMEETFDRYIRDQRHFRAVVRYIENNPVKAGLCKKPSDWQFSSARFREIL